jgi:hypothetical protein
LFKYAAECKPTQALNRHQLTCLQIVTLHMPTTTFQAKKI